MKYAIGIDGGRNQNPWGSWRIGMAVCWRVRQ